MNHKYWLEGQQTGKLIKLQKFVISRGLIDKVKTMVYIKYYEFYSLKKMIKKFKKNHYTE